MTTPMPADYPETRVVEVTQADREAAMRAGDEAFRNVDVQACGDIDWHALFVAFARHRLRSTDQQGMVRGARRASAIDANDVLQRQRRHKGALHRDDIIAAMQIYAEQYARAALTGSEAR